MLGLFKSASKTPASDARSPGWFDRLKAGLKNTGSRLGDLLVSRKIDESLFDEIEAALLLADTGVGATTDVLKKLRERAARKRLETGDDLRLELHEILVEVLLPLETSIDFAREKPLVILLAGVNGAGKTTSIGKIARLVRSRGLSVMLAAGDTFRAAAREQLAAWGERNQVTVISQQGADSASVIFDAIQAAKARGIDVVLADTAGRLHTQTHLMEELRKIKRVVAKADALAPHEVWLVLDANTGQNAVAQFKAFHGALDLTGLILTKLDGTAKGGVIAAIAQAQTEPGTRPGVANARGGEPRKVPVAFIGMGEGIEDLQPFVADEFVSALLSKD